MSQFVCAVCDMVVEKDSRSVHESSIAHLLNKNSKRDPSSSNPVPPVFGISRENIGFKMLVKMNWNEESGLGKNNQGRKFPIQPKMKTDRRGIHAAEEGEGRSDSTESRKRKKKNEDIEDSDEDQQDKDDDNSKIFKKTFYSKKEREEQIKKEQQLHRRLQKELAGIGPNVVF